MTLLPNSSKLTKTHSNRPPKLNRFRVTRLLTIFLSLTASTYAQRRYVEVGPRGNDDISNPLQETQLKKSKEAYKSNKHVSKTEFDKVFKSVPQTLPSHLSCYFH